MNRKTLKTHQAYRKEVGNRQRLNTALHDSAILLLAGVGLYGSLFWIQDVSQHLWMLDIAQILFIVSISAILVSFPISQHAQDQAQDTDFRYRILDQEDAIDETNYWDIGVNYLGWIGLICCVGGIALLAMFIKYN